MSLVVQCTPVSGRRRVAVWPGSSAKNPDERDPSDELVRSRRSFTATASEEETSEQISSPDFECRTRFCDVHDFAGARRRKADEVVLLPHDPAERG